MRNPEKINIWDGIDFSLPDYKSAYDYLLDQRSNLISETSGVLSMEVETLRELSILFVVSPALNNYRFEVLRISNSFGRFPVDIIYNEGEDSKFIENVQELDFLDKVSSVMQNHYIKSSIRNLYMMSKQPREKKFYN